MEYIEVTGKSVEEAITNACTKLEIGRASCRERV